MPDQLGAVRGVGVALVILSLCGQWWLFSRLSVPTAGEWVLYLSPAFGLLGFVGVGIILTSFMDR